MGLLPHKENMTNEEMLQEIADYVIHTAISTIEFEKVLSGDVAMYKAGKGVNSALDDRVKRYSALSSTRSVLRQTYPQGHLDFNTENYSVLTL